MGDTIISIMHEIFGDTVTPFKLKGLTGDLEMVHIDPFTFLIETPKLHLVHTAEDFYEPLFTNRNYTPRALKAKLRKLYPLHQLKYFPHFSIKATCSLFNIPELKDTLYAVKYIVLLRNGGISNVEGDGLPRV